MSEQARGWHRQATQALWLHRQDSLVYDALVMLCFAFMVGSLLHPDLLSTDALPTGGDTASQVLYAEVFQKEILATGRLTGWMPEVFAGFPVMSYYFPLPFIVAAGLGQGMGFAAGLKWAMVLPSLLLPGTVFALSRHMLRLPSLAAWCAALGTLAFLLHEQNAIWGGNLLSVLAGEFAYSWGLWLALMTMAAWWKAAQAPASPAAWALPAALEALTGLCHGYPLLWVGSASWLLLLSGRSARQTAVMLLKGHALAFALLGAWLWPLLEMHAYTIPNDAATPLNSFSDALPPSLWPVLCAGILGLAMWLLRYRARPRFDEAQHSAPDGVSAPDTGHTVRTDPMSLLAFAGLSSAWAVCACLGAERVGLLDVRFLPLAWLAGAIVCGWMCGLALDYLGTPLTRLAVGLALMCSVLAWLGPRVREAPSWAHWNHSGLETKPQWQVLSRLLPLMSGTLSSPRLLFEHDPANSDLGSTRVLESLPMFLGGRPVLEGLYMESALLGPAIYQLQSEVSTRPSSPLVRFPSGELDPEMAATHMQMLNANQVLMRSAEAAKALEESGLFATEASAGPFKLMRLNGFVDTLVDASPRPWVTKPRNGWMVDSHRWFKSALLMQAGWPVYTDQAPTPSLRANLASENSAQEHRGSTTSRVSERLPPPRVSSLELTRHRISFQTDGLGQPHLVKMAFHPRWQLRTKGSLMLAAPGFMLVTPEEAKVELHYGTTWIGWWGLGASWVSLCLLLWGFMKQYLAGLPHAQPRRGGSTLVPVDQFQAASRWWAGVTTLVLTLALLSFNSPGIAYHDAWDAFRQGRHDRAADLFFDAYKGRRSPAGKEEALFWSAKSAELAGHRQVALGRYQSLTQDHHGHWVPESLHAVAQLSRALGDDKAAAAAMQRLQEEFPRSRWARQISDQRSALP